MASTPKRKQLTRNQRLQILTLHQAGWGIDAIHAHFQLYLSNLSLRQIEYTCQFTHPTLKQRSGRPPLLNEEQKNQLIAFICT